MVIGKFWLPKYRETCREFDIARYDCVVSSIWEWKQWLKIRTINVNLRETTFSKSPNLYLIIEKLAAVEFYTALSHPFLKIEEKKNLWISSLKAKHYRWKFLDFNFFVHHVEFEIFKWPPRRFWTRWRMKLANDLIQDLSKTYTLHIL